MKEYQKAHPEKWSTEATRIIRKRHYDKHRVRLLDEMKAKRAVIQLRIDKIKSVPCLDCKQCFPPYVMDFDHVRGKKLFQIAGHLHYQWKRVKAGIKKCDVVCSNCHRFRTFRHKEEKK